MKANEFEGMTDAEIAEAAIDSNQEFSTPTEAPPPPPPSPEVAKARREATIKRRRDREAMDRDGLKRKPTIDGYADAHPPMTPEEEESDRARKILEFQMMSYEEALKDGKPFEWEWGPKPPKVVELDRKYSKPATQGDQP